MQARERKVKLPPIERPSTTQLKRRREAFARITAVRDAMEPLGRSVADLIREDRYGDEREANG